VNIDNQIQCKAGKHHHFEALLTEISARFVNLPVEQIDGTIEDAQREICECLGVDLSALWQWTDTKPRILTLTHLFSPPPPLGPERPDGINAEEAFPWVCSKALKGETLVISTESMPSEAAQDQASRRGFNVKSSVVIPISAGGGPVIGVLSFDDLQTDRKWLQETVDRLNLIAQVFTNALSRKRSDIELREQLEEITNLKQQLEKDNINLRKEIELQHVHEDIVGRSQAMQHILGQVEQVAQTDATVLIEGETGTGKELLARTVHRLSDRKNRPMVTVNCASLPPTLVESELFGREKGAYTGALTRMTGRFETADGATIFLDEIGELPLDVQAKLLRVLEQGTFERLGSTQSMQVDVRVIAATNQELSRLAETGGFRKDLYYRLNVFPIHIPPLRERPEDIPPLVWHFVRQFEHKMGRRIDHIPRSDMHELMGYAWPGNARELKNLIERAMIVCNSRTLKVHPPIGNNVELLQAQTLEETERRHLLSVLERTGWRLSGPRGAAGILGLKRTTLQSKMKKLGIVRPKNA